MSRHLNTAATASSSTPSLLTSQHNPALLIAETMRALSLFLAIAIKLQQQHPNGMADGIFDMSNIRVNAIPDTRSCTPNDITLVNNGYTSLVTDGIDRSVDNIIKYLRHIESEFSSARDRAILSDRFQSLFERMNEYRFAYNELSLQRVIDEIQAQILCFKISAALSATGLELNPLAAVGTPEHCIYKLRSLLEKYRIFTISGLNLHHVDLSIADWLKTLDDTLREFLYKQLSPVAPTESALIRLLVTYQVIDPRQHSLREVTSGISRWETHRYLWDPSA